MNQETPATAVAHVQPRISWLTRLLQTWAERRKAAVEAAAIHDPVTVSIRRYRERLDAEEAQAKLAARAVMKAMEPFLVAGGVTVEEQAALATVLFNIARKTYGGS